MRASSSTNVAPQYGFADQLQATWIKTPGTHFGARRISRLGRKRLNDPVGEIRQLKRLAQDVQIRQPAAQPRAFSRNFILCVAGHEHEAYVRVLFADRFFDVESGKSA